MGEPVRPLRLHDLEQITKRHRVGRLRVNEKNRRAARAWTRRVVDDPEAAVTQVLEGGGDVTYANGKMHEAAAPAVLRDLLRDRRVCRQRLEQLYEVGPVTHLQHHLPHLVAPKDLFTMHFAEPERPIRIDLRLELARRNGYCDVIEERRN